MLRELTEEECKVVTGGIEVFGAVMGGLGEGLGEAFSGGGPGDIIRGVTFGAASGFFGGIAGATTGFARYAFGAYSVGMAAAGGAGGVEERES